MFACCIDIKQKFSYSSCLHEPASLMVNRSCSVQVSEISDKSKYIIVTILLWTFNYILSAIHLYTHLFCTLYHCSVTQHSTWLNVEVVCLRTNNLLLAGSSSVTTKHW